MHSSRTQIEGCAFGVTALAQTADGYLWMGTVDGMVRYDGLAVTRWTPSAGDHLAGEVIGALRVASSGALWIGTSAGLSRLADGHLTTYTRRHGLSQGQVLAIVEDSAGVIWVGTGGASGGGLVSIDQNGLKRHPVSATSPDPSVLSLFEDRRHHLWIGTSHGLYRRTEASAGPASLLRERGGSVISMTEDASGQLLFIDSGRQGVGLGGGASSAVQAHTGPIAVPSKVLRDRHGGLWIGTAGQGIYRLCNGELERFTRRDGLSGDLVTALFEDAEGNVWVGTTAGVDQFREPGVIRWSTAEGLSGNVVTAVLGDSRGGVYAGVLGTGLCRIRNGKVGSGFGGARWEHANVMALYEGKDGRLWAATTRGFGFLCGRQFTEVRAADGRPIVHGFIIAQDGAGTVWIADKQLGLLNVRAGRGVAAGIPRIADRNIYALRARGNGEIWIGYFEGGITVVGTDGRVLASHDALNGVAPGAIHEFYEDNKGSMWVAAAGGLSRYRNGRWTTWTDRQRLPKGGVQAIVEDRRGGLWMTTAAGLIHMGREQCDRCPDGRPESLSFAVIGPGDGFRPRRSRTPFTPRMTVSSDGQLWISTEDGLANVDPARERGASRPVQVVISRVSVDGTPVDLTGGEVAFRGHVVELEYTAPTFTTPEAVLFRYKLDGFEHDWTYSSTSRKIAYTNLPPGRHLFRVMATNADGTWNERATTLRLHRLPHFYQTAPFVVLCVAILVLCAYLTHLLRVRQLRARFRLVLQERSRLTREIHDTVLQGFAGVVYQLDAASCCLEREPEVSRQMLDRALNRADQALQEARRAISGMRVPVLENQSLHEALSAMGKQEVEGSSIAFEIAVKGRIRQLRYPVETALYLIGREAVTNAVSHSGADRITLVLVYSEAGIRLVVRDNGAGFDPKRIWCDGHLGLKAMHERADEIAAAFEISSVPEHGTTVEVDVPDKPRGRSRTLPER